MDIRQTILNAISFLREDKETLTETDKKKFILYYPESFVSIDVKAENLASNRLIKATRYDDYDTCLAESLKYLNGKNEQPLVGKLGDVIEKNLISTEKLFESLKKEL